MRPHFGCDNKGTVSHGNIPPHKMPENQSQANVLRVLKNTIKGLPYKVNMYHMMVNINKTLP